MNKNYKIAVQVPAFNEEDHIIETIEDIRHSLTQERFTKFEIIVINDGSTDNTMANIKKTGIKNIVNFEHHQGLGIAFKEGLKKCLELGADVIVNTDADLQYRAKEIGKLVQPILDDTADMVIGNRHISRLKKYPTYKLISQALGNMLISKLFRTDILDSTCGFRAFSRTCAELLVRELKNPYTYTAESICIALREKKRISFVSINIRSPKRKSRLIKSKVFYVKNYIGTVLKYYRQKRV